MIPCNTENDREIRHKLFRLIMDRPDFCYIMPNPHKWQSFIMLDFPKLADTGKYSTWEAIDSFLQENGR